MTQRIMAVGFDLFNTLISMEIIALKDALSKLTISLCENGLTVEHEPFVEAHREAVFAFLEKARQDGRESHNRFWISAALNRLGHAVSPDAPQIAAAVDSYFSAFIKYAKVIPGTMEMLAALRDRYKIGLLSNFTHPPAATQIISELGLEPFFDVVLISGGLGYRKPHPLVFRELIDQLGVAKDQIVYVGDDPEADIDGALQAGLQPVWTTYVRDNSLSPAPGFQNPSVKDPGSDVPRISNWQDLLSFLDGN